MSKEYYKEQEIVDWAVAKGIIAKDDRLAQSFKTYEEVSELIKNFLKGKSVVDDIGDVYVTIVVQAHMNGLNMKEIHENPNEFLKTEDTKEQLAYMTMDVAMLIEGIVADSNEDIGYWISNIYNGLIIIADTQGVSLPRCIDHAYNEIKGRTGVMLNGVFVKDESI